MTKENLPAPTPRVPAAERERLDALARMATGSPWHVNEHYPAGGDWPSRYVEGPESTICQTGNRPHDADYIAAVHPAAVLNLLADLRDAEARAAAAEASLARTWRETASNLFDIASRIGVACTPEWARHEIEAVARKLQFWADTPGRGK